MKTSEKIIEYISMHEEVPASELARYLGTTERAVFKQLRALQDKGVITKKGKPPRVYYMVLEPSRKMDVRDALSIRDSIQFDYIEGDLKQFIDDKFYQITPTGSIEQGFEGFCKWCENRQLPLEKTAKEYRDILGKYHEYFNEMGLIDGMKKLQSTFSEVFLDEIYYLDFYSIERFGKTRLGQKLLYAKQSQDKNLISNLSNEVSPSIKKFIKKEDIEAVGFIPPTVKRKVQFINELRRNMSLKLPEISIKKLETDVPVAQKTLSKLVDRIENAKTTLVVTERRNFRKVLLIDDAVGSGATLNEVARKLKERGLVENVFGISITGSFKGFDVISEV